MSSIPTQANMAGLVQLTRDALSDLAGGYASGLLDEASFDASMRTALRDAHARAVQLGRNRAGDFFPFEADDRAFADLVMAEEGKYLDGFAADLREGRYHGEGDTLVAEAVERRARLYADRLVGTANEAFTLASDDEELWTWGMGDTEAHCTACPELAEGSPYKLADLPTVPGRNETPCLWNCLCRLIRGDGREGFTAVG